MKAEYVNPFYIAACDVFELMLSLHPKRSSLKAVEELINTKEASVVLGVTGDLKGIVIFSFPKEMALEMVKIMSGIEMEEIDGFVSSALGEIGNIISGNALTLLSKNNYKCDITPPQILVGKYKTFSAPNEKSLLLSLSTEIGEFDISMLLKEK
ncbi:MAG TPA: chemotaxis protein CheX [Clostridiaceae bacterium]|nr:chemotaxis protein CheX [Clostridiaceae bacterium]